MKEGQLSIQLNQYLCKCEKADPGILMFFSGKSMHFLLVLVFSFETGSHAM